MTRNFIKKSNGLTLLETIISVAVFLLVATAICFVFNRSLFVFRSSTDKSSAVQEAQTAMEWLARDIQAAQAIIIAEDDNIALVTPDCGYIHYYRDGNDPTEIYRRDCNDPEYLLAEGVSEFSFKYYDITNTQLANPETNNSSLKTIEIDITTQRNNQAFQLNTVARFEPSPDYSWAKAYGGTARENLHFLQQTSDGGYIFGGATYSFGVDANDFLVIKTDAQGGLDTNFGTTGARTYGGTASDSVRSVQQTSDRGYILGGVTTSSGAGFSDFLVIKTDAQGDLDPSFGTTGARTYGGTQNEILYSIRQTSDGGYILGGYTYSFGVDANDFLVIKTDAQGDLDTTFSTTGARAYGGTGQEFFGSIQQTSDGGYIFGGPTASFGAGSSDFLVIKTDAQGGLDTSFGTTGARTYGGTEGDVLYFLQQTSDGGYILGGATESFGAGSNDFLVIKTDAQGNLDTNFGTTGARTYGETSWEYVRFLQQTSDGGYILAGDTAETFGSSYCDSLLIKTDAQGDLDLSFGTTGAWAYGNTGYESFSSLQQTSDGGYIFGGYTDSLGAGSGDFLIIKTDASGDLGCCYISQNISPALGYPSIVDSDVTVSATPVTPTVNAPSVTVNNPAPTPTLVCPSPD